MSESLIDFIPGELREPMDDADQLLPLLLPHYLKEEPFNVSLAYMRGALDHQDRVLDEDSLVFKGTITEVEEITRNLSGGKKALGKKAVIRFRSWDKDENKETDQEITTGWLEYFGYDPLQYTWELALSHTMVSIAEENIGKECFLRKAFMEAELSKGNRVRYLADLRPNLYSHKDDDDKKGRKKTRRSSSRSTSQMTAEELAREAGDKDFDLLSEDDYEVLAEIINEFDDDEERIISEAASEFQVDEDALLDKVPEGKRFYRNLVHGISDL